MDEVCMMILLVLGQIRPESDAYNWGQRTRYGCPEGGVR
jgi:hypothetical protein